MKELCILARLCSYENETPVRGAWRGLMVPRAGLSFLLSHDALRTNKRADSRVCIMNLLRSGLLICGNSRRPRQYSCSLIDTRRRREVWGSQKFNVTNPSPHTPGNANSAPKVCACYSPPSVTGFLCVTCSSGVEIRHFALPRPHRSVCLRTQLLHPSDRCSAPYSPTLR
jgi:hypothetical protein